MAPRLALAFGLCLCLAAGAAAAGGGGGVVNLGRSTTFAELEPLAGQWNFALSVSTPATEGSFIPRVCDLPAITAPCNKPQLTADSKDKLRVTATLNGTKLTTAGGLPATNVTIKLCYSKPFVADRPWRKPSPIIDYDRSCPFVVAKFPVLANNTYEATMAVPKGMPAATLYAMVVVECKNGTSTKPTVCQIDSTKGKAFLSTKAIASLPKSLIAAAAVCSAIGPTFLAAFFIKERVMKKKQ